MHRSPSKEMTTNSPHKVMHKSHSKEVLTNSPHKKAPNLPPSATSASTSAQGSPRRLRKLQSAHQLSSNYTALNAPSLITQQRQQQQQQSTTTAQNPAIPPVPPLPSPPKQSRPRSNSDVPSPRTIPSPRRFVVQNRREDPRNELKALLRRSPRNNVPEALDDLRHFILVDGLEADNDGMACGFWHLPPL